MPHEGLAPLDWIVIAAYGIGMLVMGAYYARRQESVEDFFVGGRSLNSTAVGISLVATLLSTISYLSTPGEMVAKGPIIALYAMGAPITYLVVGFFLLPLIMRHRVTSAYEFLESRLGLESRLLAAAMFLLLRFVWMGVMINVAAVAVVGVVGLTEAQTQWAVPLAILICGVVAVVYTAMGGLRAVVTTDVVQFVLLVGGALLTIGLVTRRFGGFGWWPTEWQSHWQSQPVFSFDPRVRITLVGTIVSGSLWWICTAGSDQTAIQRFMATGSATAARRSFLINLIADVILTLILALVGLAVLGFYTQRLATGEMSIDLVAEGDSLFPRFIANELPMGVAGLVVAAMFAAVMSSLDSGLNSTASVIITDFVRRFGRKSHTAAEDLRLSRYLTLGIGALIVVLALFVKEVPGNILEVSQKTLGLFVSPLAGIYFLALFVGSGTSFGAMYGVWYSFVTAFAIAFWDIITGGPVLSFQWISPCSLTVSLLVGWLFSQLPVRTMTPTGRWMTHIIAALPVAAVSLWIAWSLMTG